MKWWIILFCIAWKSQEISGIVLNCDDKIADVGHGHYDTCEVSKPPLDTTNGKIIDNAFAWPLSKHIERIKQLYAEHVNCVNFPARLEIFFPNLEVIRLWDAKVKYIDPIDLRFLSQLKIFDLEDNDVEILQSNLFLYNIRLTEIYLHKNKIKFIADGVFLIPLLQVLKLEGNLCVSGNANSPESITQLKQQIFAGCSAPQHIISKNKQLLKQAIEVNFTLAETSKRRDFLESEVKKLNFEVQTCESTSIDLKNENFRQNLQIKKDTSALKRIQEEIKGIKVSNAELIVENVKLTNELQRSNVKSSMNEDDIVNILKNISTSCDSSSPVNLEFLKMRYENEKLLRENLALKLFKQDVERDWRKVNLECEFVDWKGYTCQARKFKVNLADAEIQTVVGFHLKRKTNFDVKKLIVKSEDVKTLFLPINIGSTFQKLTTLVVLDSSLVSVKSENFDNMPELKELILSYNSIERVPEDAFYYPVNVEKLSLSYNRIINFERDTFKYLHALKFIFLNGNKLQQLNSNLLKFNQNLELIDLQNNQIVFIGMDILNSLRKLAYINLQNNLCIRGKYIDQSSMSMLKNTIKSNCSAPKEMDCSYEVIDTHYSCTANLMIENQNTIIFHVNGFHKQHKDVEDVVQLIVRNQKMQYFPIGLNTIFESLERVVAEGNTLSSLLKNNFDGLKDLNFLSLSKNEIDSVSGEAFNGLRKLQVLDLSRNKIVSLDQKTFSPLQALKKLIIAHNVIERLGQNLLAHNMQLNEFSASNNQLRHIDPHLLNNLNSLTKVELLNNACLSKSFPLISIQELKLQILENCK